MIRGLDRRLRNLESIGRRIERSKAGAPGEFDNLSDEELECSIRQGLVRLGSMSDSDTSICRRIERFEAPEPIEFENLSDDELERALRQRAVELGFVSDSDTQHCVSRKSRVFTRDDPHRAGRPPIEATDENGGGAGVRLRKRHQKKG
jgi:hypothetical protein